MAKQTYTVGQTLTAAQMTTLQANDYNQTVSAKVASHTLVSTDAGTRITMSNASATTITVNTALFTAGDTLEITNIGAGVCTVTAGTATVSTSSTLALKQFDSGQLYFTSTGVAIFFASDAADSPLTTKGDLFTFTTTDARLAVGANGDTLVADSATATGLRYQPTTAAGKNSIINGGMDVWQRGTSGTTRGYNSADRYFLNNPGVAGRTYSRQASDITGFQYFMRMQRTAGNTATDGFNVTYNLESADSYRFAGQTVTLSWYMRKGATYSGAGLRGGLYSGTGTDQNIDNSYTGTATVATFSQTPTTSWVRYSITGTVSSSATELAFSLVWDPSGTAGATDYLDLTGFQLEIGSVFTQFMRTGGNIQGELATCQRYFYREESSSTSGFNFATGTYYNTTDANLWKQFPVQMRGNPTFSGTVGSLVVYANGSSKTPTGLALSQASKYGAMVYTTGITGATSGNACLFQTNGTTNTILDFSAEL